MPMIRKRTTMTANGTATPLSGDTYEILPFPALCEFAVLGDAGATVRASVTSGTDVLQSNSQIDLLAVASPILYPDHYTLNDIANRGERLVVELTEMAAGTPIVRTQVRITPV